MGRGRVAELAAEIARRDRAVVPRLRVGAVTTISPSTGRVRVDVTDQVWLKHDAGYAPVVGDKVYLLQQGPTGVVIGKLATGA